MTFNILEGEIFEKSEHSELKNYKLKLDLPEKISFNYETSEVKYKSRGKK